MQEKYCPRTRAVVSGPALLPSSPASSSALLRWQALRSRPGSAQRVADAALDRELTLSLSPAVARALPLLLLDASSLQWRRRDCGGSIQMPMLAVLHDNGHDEEKRSRQWPPCQPPCPALTAMRTGNARESLSIERCPTVTSRARSPEPRVGVDAAEGGTRQRPRRGRRQPRWARRRAQTYRRRADRAPLAPRRPAACDRGESTAVGLRGGVGSVLAHGEAPGPRARRARRSGGSVSSCNRVSSATRRRRNAGPGHMHRRPILHTHAQRDSLRCPSRHARRPPRSLSTAVTSKTPEAECLDDESLGLVCEAPVAPHRHPGRRSSATDGGRRGRRQRP